MHKAFHDGGRHVREIGVVNIETCIPRSIPRTALVTGAGRRIGRAIALELAAGGFDVALHCNESRDAAEIAAAEIRASGHHAFVVQRRLDEAELDEIVSDSIANAHTPLGVLINNASRFERDECHDADRGSWDIHMQPNFRAPFRLTQCFATQLPAQYHGVVINLIDQRVWSLTPHFVSYTLSKAGLWAMTQSLALALAPRIRVCAIGPGPALPSARQSQAEFDRQFRSTPLHRGTSPEEIAQAVLMILAMPSFTGQMLALDGGQHLQWQSAGTAGGVVE